MRPHRHVRAKTKADYEAKQALIDAQARLKPDVAPVIALVDGRKVSLGYRASPNMKQAHSIRIHFAPLGGSSNPDRSLTTRQVQAKYSTQPLNCGNTPKMVHDTTEVKVRTGTIPSRIITVTDKDTGETKRIKTRPKPKWGPVGSAPKDGGIDW